MPHLLEPPRHAGRHRGAAAGSLAGAMTSAHLPVTVVISTYQEGDALAATVASVLAATWLPAEIVIVDDGSTDGSTAGDWPAPVRVLGRPHEGIAPARNAGARAATLPPLLDAIERQPDALAGPAVHDWREPALAGCGARLVDPLFTYQWCRPAADAVHEVGLVPGGCLAVRTARFLAEGGFGPFREFGLEDVDLSLRWWRAGFPLLGVPASHVTHRFRATAPYPPARRAWLENVLVTALRHLSGPRLEKCVRRCGQLAGFNEAIAAVLGRVPQREWARAEHSVPMERYCQRWAPGM